MNNIHNIKNIIRTFSFILVLISFAVFFQQNVKAATNGIFKIAVPNSGTLIQGCSYSADIRVNSGTNQVNASDVIVTFDPSKIEIIDSDTNLAGTQIKQGVAFEIYPSAGNIVDQNTGMIRLSGVSLSKTFTGEDIFGTIQFKGKPGATNGAFNITFSGIGSTLDSNIAEANTSTDVLGSVVNAPINFSAGSCISDTTPPNINFINPVNNQSNVASFSTINLNITDNLSGVNISTLQIYVNGILYDSLSPALTINGSPNNYSLLLTPNNPFYTNSPSNIVVLVTDMAGNLRQSTISFNYTPLPTASPTPTPKPVIPDLLPPTIDFINPIANLAMPSSDSAVVIVKDAGTGINLNNLIIFINDKKYTVNDSTVFPTGNPNEYTITIKDNFNFSQVSSSYMSVFVSDLSGNSSSGNIVFNIPANVVAENNKTCTTTSTSSSSSSNNSIVCNKTQAPLSSQVNDIQQNITDSLPSTFRPLVSEGGVFGLASIVALLPLFAQLLIMFFSLLAGGFLWPLIYAFFLPTNKKIGKVIDDFSKEGIQFVKMTVIEKTTGQIVRKAFTDFSGKFFIHLDPGTYFFILEKKGYARTQVEVLVNQSRDIDFIFEMNEESADFGEKLQFNVFKLDIKLISSYFALLLTAINLMYIRSSTALFLFIIVFIISVFLSYRSFRIKKFSKKNL